MLKNIKSTCTLSSAREWQREGVTEFCCCAGAQKVKTKAAPAQKQGGGAGQKAQQKAAAAAGALRSEAGPAARTPLPALQRNATPPMSKFQRHATPPISRGPTPPPPSIAPRQQAARAPTPPINLAGGPGQPNNGPQKGMPSFTSSDCTVTRDMVRLHLYTPHWHGIFFISIMIFKSRSCWIQGRDIKQQYVLLQLAPRHPPAQPCSAAARAPTRTRAAMRCCHGWPARAAARRRPASSLRAPKTPRPRLPSWVPERVSCSASLACCTTAASRDTSGRYGLPLKNHLPQHAISVTSNLVGVSV